MDRNNLQKFTGFAVKTLFFTNLWIILYVSIVTYLNFLYPPVVRDQLYRLAVAWPEPFEMPLYIILTGIFVILIWLWTKFEKSLRFSQPALLAGLVFLLIVFFSKLGRYPMGGEFYPYALRTDKTIYDLTVFIYLAVIALITAQIGIIGRLTKISRLMSVIFCLSAILVTAIFIFEPRFPISAHEYAYFFGPVWEVVQGKTLFTQIHVDYGFYATLLFSLLYRVGIFTFSHLPIYVWIMFIIQYFLCFYLIFKISKSAVLGFIGLFSIITINYFSFFVLPITITQYSAMRRLPSILLLFLLFKSKRIDSPKLFIIFSLFCFWITDVGVSMLLAYESTLALMFLSGKLDLKKWLKASFGLIFTVSGVFILINFLHFVFGYKLIDIPAVFDSLRQHAASGITMLPIAAHTYFWLFMLLYFASVIYFFRKNNKISRWQTLGDPQRADGHSSLSTGGKSLTESAKVEDEGTDPMLLLFSANLMLFNSLYFVGRSHDANLFDLSVLFLLNLFLLIACGWQSIRSSRLKLAFSIGLFIFLIAIPAYQRRYHITEFSIEKFSRLSRGNIFKPEMDKEVDKMFAQDSQLISQNLKETEVLILSKEDTYLLIASNKKNLLDVNPQSAIDTAAEMDFAVKRLIKVCPRKIVADCRLYNKCAPYESFSEKSLFMAPFILETIENKCGLNYKPAICNNHLCILETKK